MFEQKYIKKALFSVVFIWLFLFTNNAFAVVVKTQNKSLLESVPGLNVIESFRVKNYNQCQQKFTTYGELVAGQNINQVIDTTKRDLAYDATQKALPVELRKNDTSVTSYDSSKNFVNYHANGICAKVLGSKLIYYGFFALIILVIIKSFSK